MLLLTVNYKLFLLLFIFFSRLDIQGLDHFLSYLLDLQTAISNPPNAFILTHGHVRQQGKVSNVRTERVSVVVLEPFTSKNKLQFCGIAVSCSNVFALQVLQLSIIHSKILRKSFVGFFTKDSNQPSLVGFFHKRQ
jgi:hypothetical protein